MHYNRTSKPQLGRACKQTLLVAQKHSIPGCQQTFEARVLGHSQCVQGGEGFWWRVSWYRRFDWAWWTSKSSGSYSCWIHVPCYRNIIHICSMHINACIYTCCWSTIHINTLITKIICPNTIHTRIFTKMSSAPTHFKSTPVTFVVPTSSEQPVIVFNKLHHSWSLVLWQNEKNMRSCKLTF